MLSTPGLFIMIHYGPLSRYVKLRFAHALGMPGMPVVVGKTLPPFPANAQPAILRIGQEAYTKTRG